MTAVFICEACNTKCGYDRVERRVELREAHSQKRLKTNKIADLCGTCARLEMYEARPVKTTKQGNLL